MRAAGRGRVITVTSVGGVVGQPFADAYCGAKFAVEGLMQSLAPVMSEFGVQIGVVEPAAVASDFVSNTGVNQDGPERSWRPVWPAPRGLSPAGPPVRSPRHSIRVRRPPSSSRPQRHGRPSSVGKPPPARPRSRGSQLQTLMARACWTRPAAGSAQKPVAQRERATSRCCPQQHAFLASRISKSAERTLRRPARVSVFLVCTFTPIAPGHSGLSSDQGRARETTPACGFAFSENEVRAKAGS